MLFRSEEIMKNPEVDKTRKLVICCSRGINSKEIAKKLEEEGKIRFFTRKICALHKLEMR